MNSIFQSTLLIVVIFLTGCYSNKATTSSYESSSYDSYDQLGSLYENSISDASFEFENQIILSYSGSENDIVSKVNAGNISIEYGNKIEKKKVRKIIKNARYTLSVKEVDTIRNKIEHLAEKYGGYLQTSGTYETVIRVEVEKLELALTEIESLGEVIRKSVSGDDVSDNFYDAQLRLDNALNSRERYLELLKQAENVTAALLVEKELERLNQTIELLKANMGNIDHLSSFATILIQIQEKPKLGVLGLIGKGLFKSVKWLFVRN